MESVWHKTEMPEFERLKGNLNTDVLVIGGGMVGILCTYFLTQNGVNCALVEQGRIGSGVTGNTTAKITAQHGLIYGKIYGKYGAEAAKKYYVANAQAVQTYGKLCADIDCDFEWKENAVYARDDRRLLERETETLEKIGAKAYLTEPSDLPFSVAGAVVLPDGAQFHPLKFLAAISKSLPIYENTAVREMFGNTAVTDCGKIHAKEVLVATHFPFLNKHGGYFLKLYQERSYVIALQNAGRVGRMYVDEQTDGLSFREYGDLLLLGGGGGHTGKPMGGWSELRQFARTHYPESQEKFFWATQDCMTLDGMPYIGRYSASTPHLWVATGFGKWGMTGSMMAAEILCDEILGRPNDAADLFRPSRSMLHRQLLINGWNAATNLLTFSEKRCPHLGCALKWNPAEHSWDCPCHGSRFSENGELLDNPATGNLKKM